PLERSQVRVFLAPRSGGGWEGTGSPWFKLTSNDPVESGAVDSPPAGSNRAPGSVGRPMPGPDPTRTGKSALAAIGLTGEAKTIQGRFVVRVSSVEPGGPSQRAGLEPGDIIIGLNDKALTGMEQLDAIGQQGGQFTLAILDVNTG